MANLVCKVRLWPIWVAATLAILAVACSSAPAETPSPVPKAESETVSPKAAVVSPVADEEVRLPAFMKLGWETDFSKHTVPYDEIKPGGPVRDGIPPLDATVFVSASKAPDYMSDDEPVISLDINGDRRAYLLAVMMKHEIVNDEVGGRPVTVTYCPLCNTGIAFDRTVGGRVFDFGTTGNLRNSNLIMWDRQTQSWWQQTTGDAIVGELTGTMLSLIPVQILPWAAFRDAFPEGLLLTRDTGFDFVYDSPPYGGYDVLATQKAIIATFGERGLQPRDRVVSLIVDGNSVAYPFSLLQEHPVINDTVAGRVIVIFFVGRTLSPFPEQVDPAASGEFDSLTVPAKRDALSFKTVGSTAVFPPTVNGMSLTFEAREGEIVDRETGSKWDILGRAVAGRLEGASLAPVVHGNDFWFSWVAFHPDTEVRTAEDIGL